jgi:2-C-methyl-D-erythritol 4-phosphate cytidylyltransferase
MGKTSTDSHPEPAHWALIPCAGRGTRATKEGPKQYQSILGNPLLHYTVKAFESVGAIRQVVVAIAPDDTQFRQLSLGTPGKTVGINCGGSTRALTVANGLNWLAQHGAQPQDWVLVHDAARCLITPEQIERLIATCHDDPVGGLLAVPLPDTLKQAVPGDPARVMATLERQDRWLAQTPQMFRMRTLLQAMANSGAGVTDEASAVEALGLAPRLVAAGSANFKVTYADDFDTAAAVLQHRLSQTNGAGA